MTHIHFDDACVDIVIAAAVFTRSLAAARARGSSGTVSKVLTAVTGGSGVGTSLSTRAASRVQFGVVRRYLRISLLRV